MEPVSGYYDWEYKAQFTSTYQGDTGIQGGGAFSALQFEALGGGGGPVSPAIRLFMDVAYAHTDYDFGDPTPTGCSNPAACFTGSPWRNVHTVDFSPGTSLVLNDRIHIQAIVPLRWQAESGSNRSGVTAGLIGMVRLKVSDSLVTALGVGVQNELEDDTRVFPVIALDWRLRGGGRLVTRGGPYQGARAEFLIGPSDSVQFKLAAGWDRQRFRLTSGGPNPDGVGQYEAIPLLTGFQINLGKRGYLHLEGGIAVNGKLEIDDMNGNLLRAAEFDTAGLLRGGLRVDF